MSSLLANLNRPVVAILAVGLIAGWLRTAHLAYPEERVFDEYYYPKSACIFLGYSNERCDINSADERFWREDTDDTGAWVHPPLGKWMIALGELGFGTDSFGWRISGAITGTATVMLVALMAQLLFARPVWTFAAGLLLATESLHVVQSRVAMLDVFVTFWIVLGFAFLLLDRRWIASRTPEPPPADLDEGGRAPSRIRIPAPLLRPWRFAAGAAFGAGVATKWSALTAVGAAIVLAMIWEVSRRRRFGMRRPVADAIPAEGFGLVLAFLITPVLVYVVSYTGWFLHFGWDLGEWARLQGAIWSYHANLQTVDASGELVHGYLSEAWKWLLLARPVLYYADYGTEGVRQVIYANGNPAIFWGSIAAIPYAGYAWYRTRDWRAGFVVVTTLGLYLPWLLVDRPQFLFYATPLAPFLVLACVYALRDLSQLRVAGSRARPYLPVAVGLIAASVILFVWFWPTLTGGPLSEEAWKLRYWFTSWA